MTEPTKEDLQLALDCISEYERKKYSCIVDGKGLGEIYEPIIEALAKAHQDGYEKGCQYSREMWHCIKHDECGWAEDPKEAYCRKCVIEGAKMMQEAAAERAYDWGVDYAIPSDIAQAIRALDAEKIIEKGGEG